MKRNEQDNYKRVILHLDLDCFYAQVEHNRLKIPLTIPLAVQQWNGLIAVNYAARDAGIKRHMPVAEALLKCPQMRLVHVPTYSVSSITCQSQSSATEGEDEEEIVALPKYSDEMPAFRGDGTRLPPNSPDPASNKACLEPYRQASMAIFRLIRDWCSNLSDGLTLLEKGGLDEAFLDISEEVEQQLIDEFDQKYTMLRDELADLESEELETEALENLALYDISWIEQLNFTGLGESAIQEDVNVTDNSHNVSPPVGEKMRMALGKLRIWKGAQIAKDLRSRLRSELNFIASIGIGPNKMLAKLVSALYKPDKQTRIEPEAIAAFMHRVPFEKIRMMGGKMGKSVLKSSNETDPDNEDEDDNSEAEDNEQEGDHLTDAPKQVMAADLWPLSLSQLADRVGDRQTATWIHQLIRGIDTSPVTPRSLTKSFMSAKSFRPSVRDWPELHDWVVVLVGELCSRICEEKEGSARWPSTITIHFKSFSKTPSGRNSTWSNTGATTKSCEFPFSASIPGQATRAHFLSAVFKLLTSIQSGSGSIFPMSRLAVSVTNFKGMEADGKARATRVDQFFKKQSESTQNVTELPAGLDRFFPEPVKINSTPDATQPAVKIQAKKSVLELLQATAKPPNPIDITNMKEPVFKSEPPAKRSKQSKPGILKYFTNSKSPSDSKAFSTSDSDFDKQIFNCSEKFCKFTCSKLKEKEIQEHLDYHVALKLSREYS